MQISSYHRKLIDIPNETFSILSIKAATKGVSLKRLIESILEREANEVDDAELYRHLVRTQPEGKVMLSESEQNAFEQRFGLRRSK